jgi:uncharacterized protein DUF4389
MVIDVVIHGVTVDPVPRPRRRVGSAWIAGRATLRGTMPTPERRDMQQPTPAVQSSYPVQFSVDYPERSLDRVTSAFRVFVAIPILVVYCTLSSLLFLSPLLMIVFRQKYPRWWFDWNLELQRFSSRVSAYLALMSDRYPSTDDHQTVHLDYAYPDVATDLNRWLPLVKWLLAIPHYVVLVALNIAAVVVVVIVWFAILFTGRYPRGMFDFVQGVMRWNNRVVGYAFTLVTDQYPPFRLAS